MARPISEAGSPRRHPRHRPRRDRAIMWPRCCWALQIPFLGPVLHRKELGLKGIFTRPEWARSAGSSASCTPSVKLGPPPPSPSPARQERTGRGRRAWRASDRPAATRCVHRKLEPCPPKSGDRNLSLSSSPCQGGGAARPEGGFCVKSLFGAEKTVPALGGNQAWLRALQWGFPRSPKEHPEKSLPKEDRGGRGAGGERGGTGMS